MRLFFAIMLPEEVRAAVQAMQTQMRGWAGSEGVKWEEPDKFHYTLKFLGDIAVERMEAVQEAGRLAAGQSTPFTVALQGLGTFPHAHRPQVLWIGAGGAFPQLGRGAELLDKSLAERGFAPETRPFRAHLTLARMKTPAGEKAVARMLSSQQNDLKKLLEKVDKVGVFPVSSFVLVNSELCPEGSVYTVLDTFPLASA